MKRSSSTSFDDRTNIYSPTAQASPVKPEGHSHWKSSDSKFGTHEAFLTQGPLEQEFYSKEKNNSRDTKIISMRHLYLQHQIQSCRDELFRGLEFCLYNFRWWIQNYTRRAHAKKKFKGRVRLRTTFFSFGWVGRVFSCSIWKNRFWLVSGWSTFPISSERGWNGWKQWVVFFVNFVLKLFVNEMLSWVSRHWTESYW